MIDDERERSEELKRAGVDVIVRIRVDDLHDLEGLKQRLEGGRCAAAAQVAAGGQPGLRAALAGLRCALVQYAPKLHG